ncbi:MAG: 16S rRNA methyltransferase [Ktedonobacteraceae bacterium]
MARDNDEIKRLVDAVLASAKYGDVSKEFIASIATQELGKRRNAKEALKATKNKLHQVGGAYLDMQSRGRNELSPYSGWLNELRIAAQSDQREDLLAVCARIMNSHASTRERLPILDQLYRQIFAELPPIRSVLDVACGLNPLAIPWMPLANGEEGIEYYAYDIYSGMMDFLQQWMAIINVRGSAQVCDVIQKCPTQKVDLALILKTIPCLEQIDKSVGSRLLKEIQANYLVVSFPARSLRGKSKGMVEHYEARFHELIGNEKSRKIKRLVFGSELVFVIQ